MKKQHNDTQIEKNDVDNQIREFANSLKGAALWRHGCLYANAKLVERDDNLVELHTTIVSCFSARMLPQLAPSSDIETVSKESLVASLRKNETRVIKDSAELTALFKQHIQLYEHEEDRLHACLRAQRPRLYTPIDNITRKNLYEKLESLNGVLFRYSGEVYIFFIVVDVGDGTLMVKVYSIDFFYYRDGSSTLPRVRVLATIPEVCVFPVSIYFKDCLDADTQKAIKKIKKYIDGGTPVTWESVNEKIEAIRKQAVSDRIYAINRLADDILIK